MAYKSVARLKQDTRQTNSRRYTEKGVGIGGIAARTIPPKKRVFHGASSSYIFATHVVDLF